MIMTLLQFEVFVYIEKTSVNMKVSQFYSELHFSILPCLSKNLLDFSVRIKIIHGSHSLYDILTWVTLFSLPFFLYRQIPQIVIKSLSFPQKFTSVTQLQCHQKTQICNSFKSLVLDFSVRIKIIHGSHSLYDILTWVTLFSLHFCHCYWIINGEIKQTQLGITCIAPFLDLLLI
jgi:hypothetical protein